MVRASVVAALGVLPAISACRDTTAPFAADDRPEVVGTTPQRLTFSTMDDRSPTWNATSDTIYYAGYNEDLRPEAPATLLAIHREGGIARELMRNVQMASDRQRWLTTPVRAPSGDRIAFVDLEHLNTAPLCDYPFAACVRRNAPLFTASVYVRATTDESRIDGNPRLPLQMASPADTLTIGGLEAFATVYPPFQEEFLETSAFPFRPAWSPDGQRLAISDGHYIRIWDVETGDTTIVPGTEDGTAPAWSPDGTTLAFTWIERTDSSSVDCLFGVEDTTVTPTVVIWACVERRKQYTMAPARVVTVAVDGSDRQVIGDGREPVWLGNGELLFASAVAFPPEPIRRFDPRTGAGTLLVGTEGAREIAVSPDEHWIAYTRWFGARNSPRDIFVVELE